jgi:hypothetical protein
MKGFECSNFDINGNDSATSGLHLEGASYGRTDNLRISSCVLIHYYCCNAVHIDANLVRIDMGAVSGCYGMLFDGRTDGTVSAYSISLNNVILYMNSAVAQNAVWLKVADSVVFNNLMVIALSTVHASSKGVVFDYTGNAFFPCNIIFNKPDVGLYIPVAQQWANGGSASGAAGPNYINNLGEINHGRYPASLENVALDLPQKYARDIALTGQTASIGTTTIVTPPIAGLWRISYYMHITTAGSGGTLALNLGWVDPRGAQAVILGTTASAALDQKVVGTYVVRQAAASNIAFSTTSTLTGSPQYAVYISAERLS